MPLTKKSPSRSIKIGALPVFLVLTTLGLLFVLRPQITHAIDSRCYYNPIFVLGNPGACSVISDKNPYCKNPADCGVQKGITEAKNNIRGLSTTTNLRALVLGWLDLVLEYAVFFAVIILVGAGVYLVLSIGNETVFKKVLKIIQYLIFGFVIILLAYAIVNTLLRVLG